MIERGEAYMIIEKMVAAKPQKIFLALPWKAKRDTKATAAKTVRTSMKSPKIFAFSFFGAKSRKIKTYMISIAEPVPLIVDTKMLFFDTKGRPYLKYSQKLG